MHPLSELLALQAGVVSTRQMRDHGFAAHEIKRLVRRRELVRTHAGVYVNHTGELTWEQRAWSAVLSCWPAVLTHASALAAWNSIADGPDPIEIAVDVDRSVSVGPGAKVRRTRGLHARACWQLSPPRTRYDDAVIDVASSAKDDLRAISVLADACGSRRTTAARLIETLDARSRVARRDWLQSVLGDVASGTNSVLEHGYLTKVERPHGLPPGERQAHHAADGRSSYSDVEYRCFGLVLELDGRLHHASDGQQAQDMSRDLQSAASRDALTLRIGWQQVFGDPCGTADAIGRVLRRRGWHGRIPCPECAG